MVDLGAFVVPTLAAGRDDSPPRVRFGAVVSLQSNRTCTITLSGGSTPISGVRYLASVLPRPGAGVVLLADGSDLFIVGVLAATGGTPAPRVARTAGQGNQSIATGAAGAAVVFGVADGDGWSSWSAGAPTRLTAPAAGRYAVTGHVRFASNATGFRSAWILRGGSAELARVTVPAASGVDTQVSVHTPAYDLAQGDYVELWAAQTSGGALDVVRDTDRAPALSLTYLGP